MPAAAPSDLRSEPIEPIHPITAVSIIVSASLALWGLVVFSVTALIG